MPKANPVPQTQSQNRRTAKPTNTRPSIEAAQQALRERRETGASAPRRQPVLSVERLRQLGCQVDAEDFDFGPIERETGILYLDGGEVADITTANLQLQRKLERAGAVPYHCIVFTQSPYTLREYQIPKRALRVNVGTMARKALAAGR